MIVVRAPVFPYQQSLALKSKHAIVASNGLRRVISGEGHNHKGQIMKLILLRNFLLIDAAVLFLLGALLIFMPVQVERAFHFNDLPQGVSYIIGLWGCALATMGFGYFVAAIHPVRHIVWVQVGILRGAAECALGLTFLARGIVTFQQVGLGIIVAALISLAYIVLYPRKPRLAGASSGGNPS